MRNLVERNMAELLESGITVDDNGYLVMPEKEELLRVPEEFTKQLVAKCEKMSMNPMEYVDKKVYSYAHLHRNDIGSAYEPSIYSGMLFNSYC